MSSTPTPSEPTATSWYWRNQDKAKAGNKRRHFKRKYGLTIEQRDAMLEAQGSDCAICHTTDPGGQGWMVDHCHASGRIRGILCVRCNFMLGYALDNPTTLSNAITYLN